MIGVALTWNNQVDQNHFSIFYQASTRICDSIVMSIDMWCLHLYILALLCILRIVFSLCCKMDQLYRHPNFSCSGSNVKHCWPISDQSCICSIVVLFVQHFCILFILLSKLKCQTSSRRSGTCWQAPGRVFCFVYARCGTYILHYMIYILGLTYIIGAYFLFDLWCCFPTAR